MVHLVANAGFDSEANRWANGVQWASGTTLYVLAVLRTLATYRPHRFRLTVDGDEHEIEAWLVAIGNTRGYAGGMQVTPGAELDDGQLDVCVVGAVSRFEFLRSFPRFSAARTSPIRRSTCIEGRWSSSRRSKRRLRSSCTERASASGRCRREMEAVPGELQVVVPDSAPVPKKPRAQVT